MKKTLPEEKYDHKRYDFMELRKNKGRLCINVEDCFLEISLSKRWLPEVVL